jgi:uncharacterized FAD-dependent dehydrogenase
MKIRVRNLKLPLDYTAEELLKAAGKKLALPPRALSDCTIVRQATDARKKKVIFVLTAEVGLNAGYKLKPAVLAHPDVAEVLPPLPVKLAAGNRELPHRPIIVGMGPAGLFCALLLARQGYKPLLLEQGLDMKQRVRRTERFWETGLLDAKSNAQYGEGGAGAFSDGKLTTRIDDPLVDYVLSALVDLGADPAIKILKKPHVGTDAIRRLVVKLREEIIACGGEVRFAAELTDIHLQHNAVTGVEINQTQTIPGEVVVLAVGNSARPIFRLFAHKNWPLTAKAFAVGVRIEHPQALIDRMQYGGDAGHPALGPADYQFTYFDRVSGRSAYTFCMCPGGYVVAAASEDGQLVTNGMSYSGRDSGVANSAAVVTVTAADWGEDPLGGVVLQEKMEREAFLAGGGDYHAPAQYLQDFLAGDASETLSASIATYRPGLTPCNLWKVLPGYVAEVLQRAFMEWGERAPEFLDPAAVLTGVETRTSAPVRLLRDENHQSLGISGLYPCGEGAGYAGGIVSAAVDGLKVARGIMQTYARPDADL